MPEMWIWSLHREDLLEKEMAIHFNFIAWKIPQRSLAVTLHGVAKESDMTVTKQQHIQLLSHAQLHRVVKIQTWPKGLSTHITALWFLKYPPAGFAHTGHLTAPFVPRVSDVTSPTVWEMEDQKGRKGCPRWLTLLPSPQTRVKSWWAHSSAWVGFWPSWVRTECV